MEAAGRNRIPLRSGRLWPDQEEGGWAVRAIVIDPQAENGLEMRDVPRPVPSGGQVLIEVRSAGVNRADVAQREGRYQWRAQVGGSPSAVAGLEVAGVVVQVGRHVSGLAVGDPVMCMCSGGYADYVAVDHRLVLPKPERLTWAEAAATPVAFITAHDAVVTNGALRSGEKVLVTGGSSVVGLATLQVARKAGAATVIGTAGGAEKCRMLVSGGFDAAVDYTGDDVGARVIEETGGVDLTIDMVGGALMPDLIDCLKVSGRLVSVGRLAGREVSFDLDTVASNRLRLIGVSFRTRSPAEIAQVVRAFARDALPDIRSGAMRPIVAAAFPLEKARAAQDAMEAGTVPGKIVLTMSAGAETHPPT
jgi:NADPH:quinone reductase-like Zn-dependent oxidoreductase